MKCINCGAAETKVLESRSGVGGDNTRRRRECGSCHHRFTTYERIEMPQLVVIKNNGNRELFDREKMMSGLLRACEKTPVTSLQLEGMVDSIRARLAATGEREVKSADLGKMLVEALADINEVAYVRFASVYNRFESVDGFERELINIKTRRNKI